MSTPHTPSHLMVNEFRRVVFPMVFISIIIGSLILFRANDPAFTSNQAWWFFIVGFLMIGYSIFAYVQMSEIIRGKKVFHWIISGFHGVALAILHVFLVAGNISLYPLVTIGVAVVTVIISGRWPAYFMLLVRTVTLLIISLVTSIVPQSNAYEIIFALFVSIAIVEPIVLIGNRFNAQIGQMQTIHRVANELSTTIEANEVITTIIAILRDVIHADTYFLGILDGDKLRLELLYDEGENFPVQEVVLGSSPAGWVIRHQKSLLIYDTLVEADRYQINLRVIGKPKVSRSWLGAPLLVRGKILGLIAVASYRVNEFQFSDRDLLENISQQAAVAIDNSSHHAQVEEQSRRDSLTGVYNHGYFIRSLKEQLVLAVENSHPLALIMMDIDHFKHFNDCYGHQVGDDVLCQLIVAIRSHIKNTDIVGRWGGEEFAILLPNATGRQTFDIAQRISNTLKNTVITDLSGDPINSPTISQGISLFPQEASEETDFIRIADKRLYVAKARGRDQIEPSEGYWDSNHPA